jgi:hypothetical protein
MDARGPLLDGRDEVEVEGAGQVRVDPALHAHLGRAAIPRLGGLVGDLVERERVALGVHLALRERTEPAADVAHVREVDVPVHDVRDLVADGLTP